MSDDPFSPEADPYPPKREGQHSDSLLLTRREVAKLALAVPLCSALPSCAVHRLGCETLPGDPRSCRHRFCRYYQEGRRIITATESR